MMTIKQINMVICGCRKGPLHWDGVGVDRKIVIGGVKKCYLICRIEYDKETEELWFWGLDSWDSDSWAEMTRDEIH